MQGLESERLGRNGRGIANRQVRGACIPMPVRVGVARSKDRRRHCGSSALALLLLLAGSAPAQFSGLAPTDDGSQLYFVTMVRLASELSQNLPAIRYASLSSRFSVLPALGQISFRS